MKLNKAVLAAWNERKKVVAKTTQSYILAEELEAQGIALHEGATELSNSGFRDAAERVGAQSHDRRVKAHRIWADGHRDLAHITEKFLNAVKKAYGDNVKIQWTPEKEEVLLTDTEKITLS